MCNTRFMEGSGRWWFPDVPRRMLRYPVPLPERAVESSRESMRASLGTGAGDVVVLHASRMQEWKGHRVLIEALDGLRANPRWTCWIAGGGQRPEEVSYERGLHAEVDRLGLAHRFRFLGQRNDVPAIMQASDIYCQPNVAPEPFGVAFLEALAAGLPIVTTAMGGPLEIVDDRCGVLVPRNLRAVSGALAALIDDDERRGALSRAAPGRARELCDVETRICELAIAFSSLKAPGATSSGPAPDSLPEDPSSDTVLSTVARVLAEKAHRYDTVVDLGCGNGRCAQHLGGLCRNYLGGDRAEFDDFPGSAATGFRKVDLNREPYPFSESSADAVVSVGVIEHLENPRALVREMARIVRPGGWVVVTTPNQLSVTSKLHLVTRNQFPAFQRAPGLYPGRITALVEGDLRRIARECGLIDVDVRYVDQSRAPRSGQPWPAKLLARGRWFSDNLLLVARRA